jgi:3-methylfumaryl-CoA hydratase
MTASAETDFKQWIGRTETVSDVVTPTPYAALSATLDRPAERPAPGTPLPALWHWLYFLPLHRQPGACGPAASSSSMSRCGWEMR